MALAAKLRFSEEDLDKFVSFLADPDIDLINFKGGVVTTDRTQENLAIANKDREKNREKYEKRVKKNYPGENQNYPGYYPGENQNYPGYYPGENQNYPGENIQSKVNKSKEKEIKENDDRENGGPQGENRAGPQTLSSPLFLQKIKDSCSRAGFAIADNLAKKLSDLDPSWFDGSFTFPEYAALYIRGHPKYKDKHPAEQRDLFRKALWAWDNLREEYPAWREEQIDRAGKKAADHAMNNPPGECPKCGGTISVKCPKCGGFWNWDEAKREHAWMPQAENVLTNWRPGSKIVPQEVPKAEDLEF